MIEWLTSPAARWVWETRYKAPADASIEDSWQRVATAIAAREARQKLREREFSEALRGFRFVPGGRVLAGAGLSGDRTLVNCFVSRPPTGAISEAAERLHELIRTLSFGGGVGCDFSQLPPRGAGPGVLAYLRLWDAAAALTEASGARRGAMMATLAADHPDISAFVHAKDDPDALTHFNLSVLLPGGFMRRAGGTDPAAAKLLDDIVRSAWTHGEPGVLFADRINAENNLRYRETLSATNPCGEVPLPAHGACVLGSINTVALVSDPFSPAARFDFEDLAALTATAVRMLDCVIDITRYPLAAQAEHARETRRIGLGVMGLGDTLALLGFRYGSGEAVEFTRRLMRALSEAAYRASIDLAREKGPFPALRKEPYLASGFTRRLPDDIRRAIAAHGIRNSHLLAIAPTGSISLLANGVSSGIEPIFALNMKRRVVDADGAAREIEVADCAYRMWRAAGADDALKPLLVTAAEVTAEEHIAIQAAAQPFVDGAIAKTINLPETASIEDVARIFMMADAAGLKGCTVFRAGGRRCPVLSVA